MSGVSILAAGSIMDHLAPRYQWHWPDFTFTHQPGEHAGMTVDLAAFNHWVEGMIGINPDISTHIVMLG